MSWPSRSLAVVICALFVVSGALRAPAATLPPALVSKLQQDRADTAAQLKQARERLLPVVQSQREAAARAGLVDARAELVRGMGVAIDSPLPSPIRASIDSARNDAGAALKLAQSQLDAATELTATAQARSLDADRRLRAIQRAASTETKRDGSIGSWRFGSGGASVSAESIDRYLASKGSPLEGQGAAFVKSGVEHEIDPRLIVAIAGAESYFGLETCAPYNGWGWGCPNAPFKFDSWAQAIDTVTRGIRDSYVDDGLTSVGEIHLRYAPPSAANDPTGLNYAWADNVARFLIEQGGDPQDIDGVLGPSR